MIMMMIIIFTAVVCYYNLENAIFAFPNCGKVSNRIVLTFSLVAKRDWGRENIPICKHYKMLKCLWGDRIF